MPVGGPCCAEAVRLMTARSASAMLSSTACTRRAGDADADATLAIALLIDRSLVARSSSDETMVRIGRQARLTGG
jgi:hypothetical protein